MSAIRVLILDGASRVALAAVRALGLAGCDVRVGEQRRLCGRRPASFCSRRVRRSYVLPNLEEAGFLEAVVRLAAEADVVLPVATNTVMTLAGARDRISAAFPFPSLETLRLANRKDLLIGRAESWGVPVPWTWVMRDLSDAMNPPPGLTYPAVIKLRDDEGTFLEPAERYRIARTRDEMLLFAGLLHGRKPLPIVQEFIEGDGYGWSAIYDSGRQVRSFAHRRVREYPVSGGPSTTCESVRDPELERLGAAVLDGLRWHGAAMVEFKRHRRTGRFILMEVNPRLWGTLPLATACGVNFPHDLCRLALGRALEGARRYRPGRRLRFLPHDIAAVVSALKGGSRRGEYLSGFVGDLFGGVRDGVLEASDARASLRYLWNLVRS